MSNDKIEKLSPPDLNDPWKAIRELAEKLRHPTQGCPWDIKQTFSSVTSNIIEEAYELVDAIESYTSQKPDSLDHFIEEMGDLIFQVIFLSQLAKEKELFDVNDVLTGITQKLIYRHPHVFSEDVRADTSDEVLKNWEKLKVKEKKKKDKSGEKFLLGEIPLHLPALLKASRLGQKAARFHFDWPDAEGVWSKLHEEIEEAKISSADTENKEGIEEEIGDMLFTISQLARKYDIDPEAALQKANAKFMNRFHFCEKELSDKLDNNHYPSPEEWDKAWQKAKKLL